MGGQSDGWMGGMGMGEVCLKAVIGVWWAGGGVLTLPY